ncbi:MAG: hypothetical protein AAF631_08670 [Pseudomonadota bacterium]
MAETPGGMENEGAETRIALALTMVWMVICALYVLGVPGALERSSASFLNLLVTFGAMGFPVIAVWTVAGLSASIRRVRAEAAHLRATLEDMRAQVAQTPEPTAQAEALQAQLDELAALGRQTDSRLTELATRAFAAQDETPSPRTHAAALADPPPREPDLSQTALPLATPEGPERMPVTIAEFIKALNFPDNAEDREGFRVLRRAFEERELGKLLQASQDVLTLMSQDGIYMDDLTPDKPLPTVWRRFASGQRGLQVAALGGIRDRSALTLAKTRMKNDPVFRDAAHHFLRKFDQVLVSFCEQAEDAELLSMSDTRTARAFMILGRVAGSFD